MIFLFFKKKCFFFFILCPHTLLLLKPDIPNRNQIHRNHILSENHKRCLQMSFVWLSKLPPFICSIFVWIEILKIEISLTAEYVVLPSFHPPIAIKSLTFGFEFFKLMNRVKSAANFVEGLVIKSCNYSQRTVTSRVQKLYTSIGV